MIGSGRSGAAHLYPLKLGMYPIGSVLIRPVRPSGHYGECPSLCIILLCKYTCNGPATSTVSRYLGCVTGLAERQGRERAGSRDPVPGDVLRVPIGEEADIETGKVLKEASGHIERSRCAAGTHVRHLGERAHRAVAYLQVLRTDLSSASALVCIPHSSCSLRGCCWGWRWRRATSCTAVQRWLRSDPGGCSTIRTRQGPAHEVSASPYLSIG